MSERLIRTVRCPACGQLPDVTLSPRQAFCGNDDCDALMFVPARDPAEQLADRTVLPIDLIRDGAVGEQQAAAAAFARPRQVPGTVADYARELEIRTFLHGFGYRCLPGECTICDTTA